LTLANPPLFIHTDEEDKEKEDDDEDKDDKKEEKAVIDAVASARAALLKKRAKTSAGVVGEDDAAKKKAQRLARFTAAAKAAVDRADAEPVDGAGADKHLSGSSGVSGGSRKKARTSE
jgi:hypothetical protein